MMAMIDTSKHWYDERADLFDSHLGWEKLAGLDLMKTDITADIFHDWTVLDWEDKYVHSFCLVATKGYAHYQYDVVAARIYFGLFGSGTGERIIVVCENESSALRWYKDVFQRIRSRPFFRENIKKIRKGERKLYCQNGSFVQFVSKHEREMMDYAYNDCVIVVDAHLLSTRTEQYLRVKQLATPKTQLIMIGRSTLVGVVDPIGLVDRYGDELEGFSWIVD